MSITDALTITLLGMAVVFCGLFLTAGLILSFSLIPKVIRTHRNARTEGNLPEKPSTHPETQIPPEVISVIAAVLEVERRLYHADPGGRLTINRHRETTP